MEIGGINAISIGAAAVAGFIAAAIYYNLVGKQWQAATGIDDQRMHEIIGPACFITAGISQILIAGILAGLILSFRPGQPDNPLGFDHRGRIMARLRRHPHGRQSPVSGEALGTYGR